jgi:hypothetical protein
MFNPSLDTHTLYLQWWAIRRDDEERIVYYERKERGQSLSDFIAFSEAQRARVYLDYLIDGVSLLSWCSLYLRQHYHFYQEMVITAGIDINFKGTQANKGWIRLHLRQMFALPIRYEDAAQAAAVWGKMDEEQIQSILAEEQRVPLMLAGCCADRGCGVWELDKIERQADRIYWHLPVHGNLRNHSPLVIAFEWAAYERAWSELLDWAGGDGI